MKYKAKPVVVDAFVIVNTNAYRSDIDVPEATQSVKTLWLELEDGRRITENECDLGAMTARMWPKVGDYLVIQSDGYQYLNPKEVFERKYGPMLLEMNALELGAAARRAGIA